MARGDRFTVKWAQNIYYSDFDMSFSLNPTTGNLAMVTNEEAINRSIRNLVLTMNGEIPGDSSIGCKVMSSLFDNRSPQVDDIVKNSIIETLANHEPRATQVSVILNDMIDKNSISLTIRYTPINIPQVVEFSMILKRIR